MAIQYKPTKQKKEKAPKAPKAPKAEKPIKIGSAQKVKTTKPVKTPKQPKASKAAKPEKASALKLGKVEQVGVADKKAHPISLKTKVVIAAVTFVVMMGAIAALALILPAVEAREQAIVGIAITQLPDKTAYTVGEEVDYSGLRVLVTRNNGETFTVRYTACDITGFDSSTAQEGQAITVTYGGFETIYYITIKEPPKPKPVLVGIELEELPQTEYTVGEGLNTVGGVILRKYSDGSTFRVALTNQDVYGWKSNAAPGEYELTVKYMENGVIVSTTYTITVTE